MYMRLNEENDDEPVARISLYKDGIEQFQDVKLPKKVMIDGIMIRYAKKII